MNSHRENEKEFIEAVLKAHPELRGWFYDEDPSNDWYYIKQDGKPASEVILKVNEVKCAFNRYGRAINGFVKVYFPIDSRDYLYSYYYETEKLSLEDCMKFDSYVYVFEGHLGIVHNKCIDVVLSDGNTYTVVVKNTGQLFDESIFNNKLCVHGFIANSHMWTTPYKKFGTVMCDNLPFLTSPEGDILNIKKSKYKDGKIYAYVNSDRTFFYSTNSKDPKWY